jgi:hypothetical protein
MNASSSCRSICHANRQDALFPQVISTALCLLENIPHPAEHIL